MHEAITTLKLLAIGGALFVASLQDLRSREVSDKIWVFAIPVGAVLTLAEAFVTPYYPHLLSAVSLLSSVALAFGIYYIGLYGGADAKALTAIAVTFPLPPFGYVGASPIFPLTVFGNGLILSLSLIVVCVVWNTLRVLRGANLFGGLSVSGWGKVLAFLTGVKVREGTARSVHFNPMERVMENGGRGLKFIRRVEESEEECKYEGRDEDLKVPSMGEREVWATLAIPMIVFLFAGLLLYFFAGDLILRIAIQIMGR
ncbi:MAG: prepilin peptidase [Candidatus Methanomethylicaceae archaeon]